MGLKKRWGRRFLTVGYRDRGGGKCWRRFLEGEVGYNVACIESPPDDNGPYTLEIWDFPSDHWVPHATFDTLREAKIVGRLLAGIALAQDF